MTGISHAQDSLDLPVVHIVHIQLIHFRNHNNSTFLKTEKEYEAAFYDLQTTDRLWPFTKSYFQQQMVKACDEAQIERIRLHDLRHSHASFLIRMKVPILLISERLGHENVQTTLQTYGHLYPAETTEAIEKMDDLIPGKSEEVMPK